MSKPYDPPSNHPHRPCPDCRAWLEPRYRVAVHGFKTGRHWHCPSCGRNWTKDPGAAEIRRQFDRSETRRREALRRIPSLPADHYRRLGRLSAEAQGLGKGARGTREENEM